MKQKSMIEIQNAEARADLKNMLDYQVRENKARKVGGQMPYRASQYELNKIKGKIRA